MSQRNQPYEDYRHSYLKDLHDARRYALKAFENITGLHQLETDGEDETEEWQEAKAELHHAVILYYTTLKPNLMEHGIHSPEDAARVFETGDEKWFYIDQLDDFRLSYKTKEESKKKVGSSSTQVKKKKQPHTLPPEVAIECLDYLNNKLRELNLSVQTTYREETTSIADDAADLADVAESAGEEDESE